MEIKRRCKLCNKVLPLDQPRLFYCQSGCGKSIKKAKDRRRRVFERWIKKTNKAQTKNIEDRKKRKALAKKGLWHLIVGNRK